MRIAIFNQAAHARRREPVDAEQSFDKVHQQDSIG